MKRRQLWLVISAMAIAVASGCSARTPPLKWTEDVRLPDGRAVTLTRYQEFKGPHELGDTSSASDYWFEFKHPDTGQVVRWQHDRDLAALALMMDGVVPVLLVMPNFGGLDRLGCPNPPYLLYRYEGVNWRQASIDQIPIKRLRVNMTFNPKDQRKAIEGSGYHLTADQTSNSERDYRPYIINFSLMTQQTFKTENCGRTLDWLIEK